VCLDDLQVAFVNRRFTASQGIANEVRTLATHVARVGATVRVFASDVLTGGISEGLQFIPVPAYKGWFDSEGWTFALRLCRALWAAHRERPLHVVHVHDSTALYGAWLFSKITCVPVVFTYHAWIHQPAKRLMYRWDYYTVFLLNAWLAQRLADVVCCVSEEIRDGLLARYRTALST
jgi:glycogen synthase